VLVAAAGCGAIAGQLWARAVGILVAILNLIANFLFLPYSPWWSMAAIALDVAVIWALSAYRPQEVRSRRSRQRLLAVPVSRAGGIGCCGRRVLHRRICCARLSLWWGHGGSRHG
jgi:hypothetical protein